MRSRKQVTTPKELLQSVLLTGCSQKLLNSTGSFLLLSTEGFCARRPTVRHANKLAPCRAIRSAIIEVVKSPLGFDSRNPCSSNVPSLGQNVVFTICRQGHTAQSPKMARARRQFRMTLPPL